ncbi:serine/threonine-protein kinase PrkC [Siminovitchia terrae]|uniref:non-specific serine/threonine protein kinase n=1 Tax=Siminovitchia terrae TaxID=1914933 RepID=A0ABQ4KRJ4_SIMTE|nr:Stk1 family PASTA domain-containing Ser/Thr kinase [Siminovitchia terrae]GIN91421.1 serine/threonine-protein kinase PrkC [Siminovitchia terrae]GIN94643.1 serine/threonine-protein kinase PrkC [Siminovitchia terrae]
MLSGKRISGRYNIIKMVGGGGMANVYLARDMILDRDVAVKILRLDFADEEEFIRRFQREAQSATSLNHPNIVNVFDVGEEDNIYYIVMEYVDGMTLKQYIQNYYPISVEKVIDIVKQLTSALEHAHYNHIIHRDIKPQNILIDHDGNVKITDFGIAMALSATSITHTNAVLGSVHYLSPEQARGGMATKKSDIYSLGIVMFELLTGRLPFSGESAVSIALKHLQSETPPPTRWNPDIPQSVENIVLKATAKDPFLRYNSIEEMEKDLETSLDPDRLQEPKFIIPEDNEATKAIPVITDEHVESLDDDTMIHQIDNKDIAKPDKEDNGELKKKRKKWPWIVGIVAILAIAATLLIFLMPSLMGAKVVKVPDVSGEMYEDAVLSLVQEGFVIGETIEISDEDVSEGEVIKTSPKAGREVKKGSLINIYLSTGKETFELSDYKGRDYDEIVEQLEKEDFVIDKEEEYDSAAPGTIIAQDPSPGTKVVPSETTLVFKVSLGEELVTVKDLSGNNQKGLENYEESSGLKIDFSEEEYSDDVPEGLVIRQDPAPGTEVMKGSTVKVTMSKGQEEIPPGKVNKEITIPYEPEEEGKPQEVRIFIEDMNHSMTVPAETFTIDSTVKKQLEFTIEKGKKAGYKVVRDSTVILDEEVPYSDD